MVIGPSCSIPCSCKIWHLILHLYLNKAGCIIGMVCTPMYTQQVYALIVTHIDGENMVVSWSDQTNSNRVVDQAVSHRSYDIDWWRCWLNWCTQVNVISINNKYIPYYWPDDIYYCYWSKTYIIQSLRSQHTVRKLPKISHVPYSSMVNRTLISKALSRKKNLPFYDRLKICSPTHPS